MVQGSLHVQLILLLPTIVRRGFLRVLDRPAGLILPLNLLVGPLLQQVDRIDVLLCKDVRISERRWSGCFCHGRACCW